MIDKPICRRDRPHDIHVVAVCEYPGLGEPRRQERLGPGCGLAGGGPGAVPIAGQAMDETDVNLSVVSLVQNFDPVRSAGAV